MLKFSPEEPVESKGKRILQHCRKLIMKAAGDDKDKWFLINRWVFARLQLDERKTKQKIKKELKERSAKCQKCKKKSTKLHLHRKNIKKGYSKSNCELLCPDCHRKVHRKRTQSIQYPYLTKRSKRYDSKVYDKKFLYWWDITPNKREQLGDYRAVIFIEKDEEGRDDKEHIVNSKYLKRLLTKKYQTTRGDGNWGIRILSDGKLYVEPGKKSKNWKPIKEIPIK
jgi:hypothetical protein